MASQSLRPPTASTAVQRPGLSLDAELLRSTRRLSRSGRIFVFAGTVAELRSTLAELSRAAGLISTCLRATPPVGGADGG